MDWPQDKLGPGARILICYILHLETVCFSDKELTWTTVKRNPNQIKQEALLH